MYDISCPGVHAIIDGQFGSTGKGALASALAAQLYEMGTIPYRTYSNAGPNSGHTFYHYGEKHVLKQLPTVPVKTSLYGVGAIAVLTAGAIINPVILREEAERYPLVEIFVNPMAAVIKPEDIEAEHSGSVAAVAGTRSGTGAALANKVLRKPDAVVGGNMDLFRRMPPNVRVRSITPDPEWELQNGLSSWLEVSQGFSLGLNSRFYPKVTSRECTVMQGMADARVAPSMMRNIFMALRTYPIRVGNVDGFSSGEYYDDQFEVSWDELGLAPELTTVTQRVRRVFTFSTEQLSEAYKANLPTHMFINFMNYLEQEAQAQILEHITSVYPNVGVIAGYGATDNDVVFM